MKSNSEISIHQSHYKYGLAVFVLFLLILLYLSNSKYYSLHTSFMDLGLYLGNFYNIHYEAEWQRVFFGHSQPLMLLWAWCLNLIPFEYFPYFILSMQSLVLAVPVWLLWRYCNVYSAFAYILFFAVWFNALFDFHFDHLSITILFVFYILADKKRYWSAMLVALLLLPIKEVYGLQAIGCGLYLYTISRKVSPGLLLVLVAGGYFYIAIYHLIPAFSFENSGGLSSNAFSWMGSGLTEIIKYIFSNPLSIFSEIVTNQGKLIYIFALFGSVAFISLLRPVILIPALPILMISLLSKDSSYYGLGHHYTAGLIAPIIYSFSKGLNPASKYFEKLGGGIRSFHYTLFVTLLVFHILISVSPISRLYWLPKIWSYHLTAYSISIRDEKIKTAIYEIIPNDNSVVVSSQNNINNEHISNRKYSILFPFGIIKQYDYVIWQEIDSLKLIDKISSRREYGYTLKPILAEYVIIDKKRPLFIADKSCSWVYGECMDKEFEREFNNIVDGMATGFQVVYEFDGFFIFKRN